MTNQEYDRIMRALLENVDGSTISDDLKDGVSSLALAAPDLLEVCKELLQMTGMGYVYEDDPERVNRAKAAIAKTRE